jgi:hypothetical protein
MGDGTMNKIQEFELAYIPQYECEVATDDKDQRDDAACRCGIGDYYAQFEDMGHPGDEVGEHDWTTKINDR